MHKIKTRFIFPQGLSLEERHGRAKTIFRFLCVLPTSEMEVHEINEKTDNQLIGEIRIA